MTFPLIALLTDFGDADGFVGVMKGVIYTVIQTAGLPGPVTIADISHGVAPQNIRQAGWILSACVDHFPKNTVFVAVVDPKVGNADQHRLLAHWESRDLFFIAPDNGLLSPVIDRADYSLRVYRIENRACFHQDPPSRTFHGRDVYAPVAAHLACALQKGRLDGFLGTIGPQTGDFIRLKASEPLCRHTDDGVYVEGEVAYIDTFGNLITNIPNDWLADGERRTGRREVEVGIIHHAWKTQHLGAYVEGEGMERVFLVPGSSGCVELCLYGGSAKNHLEAAVSDLVSLRWRTS